MGDMTAWSGRSNGALFLEGEELPGAPRADVGSHREAADSSESAKTLTEALRRARFDTVCIEEGSGRESVGGRLTLKQSPASPLPLLFGSVVPVLGGAQEALRNLVGAQEALAVDFANFLSVRNGRTFHARDLGDSRWELTQEGAFYPYGTVELRGGQLHLGLINSYHLISDEHTALNRRQQALLREYAQSRLVAAGAPVATSHRSSAAL